MRFCSSSSFTTGETRVTLEARQTLIFEATGARKLRDGVYVSEVPGDVNVAVVGVPAPEADPVGHRMRTGGGETRGAGVGAT